MSGEVRTRWETLITGLEKDGSLRRYASCAKEPKALFDRIGEDLDSGNESIRSAAYWALVWLTPELINILHEKETRKPGWKDREGKDQKIVNEGLDGSKCILKHLHTKLVRQHDFKVLNGKKDPRPYVKKVIENWEKDEHRKRTNRDGALIEVPLDYEAALEIPDPAGFPEIEIENYDELWREYEFLFRDRDEFDLLIAHHVDKRLLEEIRERLGIRTDVNLRQRKCRINKGIIARRDEAFTSMFFGTGSRLLKKDNIEWWEERARRSIHAGNWLNGKAADVNNAVAVRPLTTGLHDAPAHIYLVGIKKDCQEVIATYPMGFGSRDNSLGKYTSYVEKLINPTGERERNNFVFRELRSHYGIKVALDEVPAIKAAFDEVPEDYYVWFVSNSYSLEADFWWYYFNGYNFYESRIADHISCRSSG